MQASEITLRYFSCRFFNFLVLQSSMVFPETAHLNTEISRLLLRALGVHALTKLQDILAAAME